MRDASGKGWSSSRAPFPSTPSGPTIGLDPRGELAQGLLALDERDREPLLLLALADLSYTQIAVALGIPEGTVRSRINRARRQLKEVTQTMNEIDRLVRELYAEDAPSPPEPEALWASVERRIGAPADFSRIRRRPRQWRVALAVGLALAGATVLAFLPARLHSPGGAIPENASAAQVLRALADRGSSLPDVPRGSFLYTSGTRIVLFGGPNDDGTSFSAFIREHWQLWVGRDGSVRQRVRTDPAFVGFPTRRDRRLARRYTGPLGIPYG